MATRIATVDIANATFDPTSLLHTTDVESMSVNPEVQTTCAYCGVGCGVLARVDTGAPLNKQALQVRGDPHHPANNGKLCVKGSALGETVHPEGRMAFPTLHGQRVSWDEVTTHIADALQHTINTYGADSVAFYVSGQLLTEDYYVVNKLAKGYIGTANVDTNSRLCMSSAVAGHKRAFGTDTVPNTYADIEAADVLVLVGSNMAWCHPILYNRIKQEKQNRPALRVVVVDPRIQASHEIADLSLQLRAGTDVLLFNYLLCYLAEHDHLHAHYLHAYVDGLDAALQAAYADVCGDDATTLLPIHTQQTAARLGLSVDVLHQFCKLFASTTRVMTLFSMGVNQSTQGTDKVNSILNCHLATGRIGQLGSGPFSLTGQPNAMGGREVGGLATMLAAHLELDQPVHRDLVQSFWQSPTIATQAGLKAVDLFRAIETGQVKAVWIMATNPIVSLPDADRVKAALQQCPLVIVSDVIANTDCTQVAHITLPALAWAEKDGTVTNSERCISRQRAVLPAWGESAPDWWALSQVARKMGFSGFDYAHPFAIFKEHAALSGYRNHVHDVLRDFDISGLADLSFADYQQLRPVQWPVPAQTWNADAAYSPKRFFAHGAFYTPNRRGRMIAVHYQPPRHAVSAAYPWVLNTGRIRDQWHTMTRTGLTARLTQHIAEPFVSLHPQDAAALGIHTHDVVEVVSQWGRCLLRAVLSEHQQQGNVFVPIHWNGVNSSQSRVGAVVNPAVDPISGQHEGKHTPVVVRKKHSVLQGFLLTQHAMPLVCLHDYAVNIRIAQGFKQEIVAFADASHTTQSILALFMQHMRHNAPEGFQLQRYEDARHGVLRLACLSTDGKLLGVLCLARQMPALPARTYFEQLLGQVIPPAEYRGLLSGVARTGLVDEGPTICSCFGVSEQTICRAIKTHCLNTVAAVGKAVKAGSNCGSCQSDIHRLIEETHAVSLERVL